MNADTLTRRTLFAVHEIKAAKKQAVSAYDADLRRLDDVLKRLTTSEAMNQPELFDDGVGSLLTPEVQQIIDQPTGRYN
jgi:hypothetical protein